MASFMEIFGGFLASPPGEGILRGEVCGLTVRQEKREMTVRLSLDELQPGDLLAFQNKGESQVGHVGMYLGDGKFIHAANSKLGIIVSDLSKWTDRLKTIRRLPELEPAVG